MKKEQMDNECLKNVSRETLGKFFSYQRELIRWNQKIALFSRKKPFDFNRHIKDSLQIVEHLGEGLSLVDLGAGGGFPGIPVALAQCKPVTFVERNEKKAIFLKYVIKKLEIKGEVFCKDGKLVSFQSPTCVMSRAAFSIKDLLLCIHQPFVKQYVLLKGSYQKEIEEAQEKFFMNIEVKENKLHKGGFIVVLKNVCPRGA